jgi:hypothetical protein
MKGNIWKRLSKLAEIDFKVQLLFIVTLALIGLIWAIVKRL